MGIVLLLTLVLASKPDAGTSGAKGVGYTADAGAIVIRDGGENLSAGFAFGRVMKAKGDLSKDEIKGVVKAHHAELNACYDALLARNAGKQPLPQGTVTMQFTVEIDGKVSEAAIAKGGLDDASLATCLTEKIRAWVFPKPSGEGPVKVGYPLKLRPPD